MKKIKNSEEKNNSSLFFYFFTPFSKSVKKINNFFTDFFPPNSLTIKSSTFSADFPVSTNVCTNV
jgi:hypothetical protein